MHIKIITFKSSWIIDLFYCNIFKNVSKSTDLRNSSILYNKSDNICNNLMGV